MTDGDRWRRHLVGDLLERGSIRSAPVRDAFLDVARERFVPELAESIGLQRVYADDMLVTRRDGRGRPVSCSSQPSTMAAMLEELRLAPGHRVLEIGTGTGYNAALLRRLVGEAGSVTSVERSGQLADLARRRLSDEGWRVEVIEGDGTAGWAQQQPYDRIIVTAQAPSVSREWLRQLAPDGLVQVPLRLGTPHAAALHLVLTFRRAGSELRSLSAIPAWFAPIVGGEPDGPAPATLSWSDQVEQDRRFGGVMGDGLTRLSRGARATLLAGIVQPGRGRRLVLADDAVRGLLLYALCTIPGQRRVGMWTAREQGVGVIGRRGGVAALEHWWDRATGRLLVAERRYGPDDEAGAELQRVLRGWRALGRPPLARFVIRVAFGRAPAGARWRLQPAGGAHAGVGLDA